MRHSKPVRLGIPIHRDRRNGTPTSREQAGGIQKQLVPAQPIYRKVTFRIKTVMTLLTDFNPVVAGQDAPPTVGCIIPKGWDFR